MERLQFRTEVLSTYGATSSEIAELLTYNQNRFDHAGFQARVFPLPPEPHLSVWEEYAVAADRVGALGALQPRLVQLQFPIQAGISEQAAYRATTRQGKPAPLDLATGLVLQEPEQLCLRIHPTLAGPLPVLVAGNRADFVTLVQAFTGKNEPIAVPDSMGACIIGGYNNWDRVQQYRHQWAQQHPDRCSEADWAAEFKRLIPQKALYQDRLILLSPGPYSNVTAAALGLTEAEWQQLSLTIRLEHECTHYFTRRVLGSMQNNLLDELIADYRGIVAANGHYRADWFLHFVGLESFPAYREGGRLQNYRGDPPLSDGAFQRLQALVKAAAENLEQFDRCFSNQPKLVADQLAILLALTTLTLEELASLTAVSILQMAVRQQQQWLAGGTQAQGVQSRFL